MPLLLGTSFKPELLEPRGTATLQRWLNPAGPPLIRAILKLATARTKADYHRI